MNWQHPHTQAFTACFWTKWSGQSFMSLWNTWKNQRVSLILGFSWQSPVIWQRQCPIMAQSLNLTGVEKPETIFIPVISVSVSKWLVHAMGTNCIKELNVVGWWVSVLLYFNGGWVDVECKIRHTQHNFHILHFSAHCDGPSIFYWINFHLTVVVISSSNLEIKALTSK